MKPPLSESSTKGIWPPVRRNPYLYYILLTKLYFFRLVPADGIEPSTYDLWGHRSNQLSYTGIYIATIPDSPRSHSSFKKLTKRMWYFIDRTTSTI